MIVSLKCVIKILKNLDFKGHTSTNIPLFEARVQCSNALIPSPNFNSTIISSFNKYFRCSPSQNKQNTNYFLLRKACRKSPQTSSVIIDYTCIDFSQNRTRHLKLKFSSVLKYCFSTESFSISRRVCDTLFVTCNSVLTG